MLDMVRYYTGNPNDINQLKVGDPQVWTPHGLRESMFNLFTCVVVMTGKYNAVEVVRDHLTTSLVVQAGGAVEIAIPDADIVKNHIGSRLYLVPN